MPSPHDSPLPRHLLWPGQAYEMAFRLIPAGTFWMGARDMRVVHTPPHSWAEPVHRVRITRPFWMAETAVTQAQFSLCPDPNASGDAPMFPGRPQCPVERVSWDQAMAFCRWLQVAEGASFPAGSWTAGLPTEAQWEYACRAGAETDYCNGDGSAALHEVGWFEGDTDLGTRPVAMKKPNRWGLFDLHGGVAEWALDDWDPDFYRKLPDGVCDPCCITHSNIKVTRGGGWVNWAEMCTSAYRYHAAQALEHWAIGFRVCLVDFAPQVADLVFRIQL